MRTGYGISKWDNISLSNGKVVLIFKLGSW